MRKREPLQGDSLLFLNCIIFYESSVRKYQRHVCITEFLISSLQGHKLHFCCTSLNLETPHFDEIGFEKCDNFIIILYCGYSDTNRITQIFTHTHACLWLFLLIYCFFLLNSFVYSSTLPNTWYSSYHPPHPVLFIHKSFNCKKLWISTKLYKTHIKYLKRK